MREEEILAIITKDPMISQEKLASHLEISRSAVAVHISNLIKKGKIAGRGYVLNHVNNVLIMGKIVANLTAEKKEGSPSIQFSIEGIGYLMSLGLAKINEKIILLSGIGHDHLGKVILDELQLSGNIDLKHMIIKPNMTTAKRISLKEPQETIEDDGALNLITPQYLESKEHLFKKVSYVINDCSFNIKTCTTMLNLCKKNQLNSINVLVDLEDINPFFSSNVLINMDIIIVWKSQLKQLGITEEIFEELINQNLIPLHSTVQLIILCEKEGVLLLTKNDIKHISLLPGQKLNKNFLVGFAYGLLNNYPMVQAIRIGLGKFQY